MSMLGKDTLHHWQQHPLGRHIKAFDVPCHVVAQKINAYFENDPLNGSADPQTMALMFYGFNHATATLAQKHDPVEVLGPQKVEFLRQYHTACSSAAIRSIYYLILICVRESRHVEHNSTISDAVIEASSKTMRDWFWSIPNGSQEAQKYFRNSPPNGTMGQLVDAMHAIFYKGGFSGGFGGPAWGAVNDCLRNYVHGTFSAEMLLDTVWTLCHNNGPIFNKGMLFDHHSTGTLQMILDVQRSGQIPQLILKAADHGIAHHVTDDMVASMQMFRQLYPDVVGPYVDWYMVEGLGAVGTYGHHKNNQVKKYGMSDWATNFEANKAKAEKLALELQAKKKAEFEKNHFTIMPGVHVKKQPSPRAVAA